MRHITFRGITFTGGDFRITQPEDVTGQHDWNFVDEPDALLRIRNAESITVEGCTFAKSGAPASGWTATPRTSWSPTTI